MTLLQQSNQSPALHATCYEEELDINRDTRNKQRIEPSPSWPIREESKELLFRTVSFH